MWKMKFMGAALAAVILSAVVAPVLTTGDPPGTVAQAAAAPAPAILALALGDPECPWYCVSNAGYPAYPEAGDHCEEFPGPFEEKRGPYQDCITDFEPELLGGSGDSTWCITAFACDDHLVGLAPSGVPILAAAVPVRVEKGVVHAACSGWILGYTGGSARPDTGRILI